MTARTRLSEKLAQQKRGDRINRLAWNLLFKCFSAWLLCVVALWVWLSPNVSAGVWLAMLGGGIAASVALSWWLAERRVDAQGSESSGSS